MLRRLTARWLPVTLIAAFMATAAVPATASATEVCVAIYPRPASCEGGGPAAVPTAGLRHTGWTYLNLNYCAPGMACAQVFRASMGAWRWTGTSWAQSSLNQGWVYVYPYTGSWRWAWTQESGWVAVTGGRFELRRY